MLDEGPAVMSQEHMGHMVYSNASMIGSCDPVTSPQVLKQVSNQSLREKTFWGSARTMGEGKLTLYYF